MDSKEIISQTDYIKKIVTRERAKQLCDNEYLKEYIPTLRKRSHSKKLKDIQEVMTKYSETGIIAIDGMPSIEAIIIPELRPVFTIKNDSYNKVDSPEWQILNNVSVKENLIQTLPSIGRIEVPTENKIPYAGTGFLVNENIIMTNRHVAEIFCSGLGINGLRFISGQTAGIDFKEEINTPIEDHVFFDIKNVLMIHPYWDMALLEVTVPKSHSNKKPLNLSLMTPDEMEGRNIAVVGYPAFDSRNDGLVQHNLFGGIYNIKRLQPGQIDGTRMVRSFDNNVRALAHDASTLGGNSGSAVIDLETGSVVGLHFAGKYLDSNFAVPMSELVKDKFVQKQNLNFSGNLPSADFFWQPSWDRANRITDPFETKNMNTDLQDQNVATENHYLKCKSNITLDGKLSITVPIELNFESTDHTISINGSDSGRSIDSGEIKEGLIGNYDEREGYEIAFLGDTVPLPWLPTESYLKVERNTHATESRHVLPYTHFSIVMNRERRLPFFTAVNIDGNDPEPLPANSGGSHSWYFDERISRDAQMDNDFYRDVGPLKNPLDRGHMVRRIEPMWGSELDTVKAHNDTFHWTNASPQHSRFNKQGFLWAKIENYLLDTAQAENKKISVFAGPVFKDSDPLYMAPAGVQVHLPLEFWKVVIYKKNGELKARGFLLSQEREVKSLIEAFDDGQYTEFQLPLSELEEVANIQFSHEQMGFDLKDFDAFESPHNEAVVVRTKLNNLNEIN